MRGVMRPPEPGEVWALVCQTPDEFWPALREAITLRPMLPWLTGHLHGYSVLGPAEREAAALKRAAVALPGVVFVRAPLDPRGGLDGHEVYLDYLDEVIEVG